MKRRGFTLIEAMAAAVLLAVAATLCLQMLMAGASARRATGQRRLAARELSNVMERIMALPDEDFTSETVQGITLSQEANEALPEAKLAVRLDDQTDGGPRGTRVTVELSWRGRAGEPTPPTRLLAWRFVRKEDQP